jgi:hypothetical protein
MTHALGEWDWWLPSTGSRLHHVAIPDTDDDTTIYHGTSACGRTSWWTIPGVFTRMEAPRCETCCDRLGYPHGKGSPKNDAACRPLVEARLAVLEDKDRVCTVCGGSGARGCSDPDCPDIDCRTCRTCDGTGVSTPRRRSTA